MEVGIGFRGLGNLRHDNAVSIVLDFRPLCEIAIVVRIDDEIAHRSRWPLLSGSDPEAEVRSRGIIVVRDDRGTVRRGISTDCKDGACRDGLGIHKEKCQQHQQQCCHSLHTFHRHSFCGGTPNNKSMRTACRKNCISIDRFLPG